MMTMAGLRLWGLMIAAAVPAAVGMKDHTLPAWAQGGRLQDVVHPVSLSTHSSKATDYYIEVPLDYNATAGATMQVRYAVDASVFDKATGPIFIHMGGEGPMRAAAPDALAVEHAALVVSLEHRFYGKSMPVGGSSLANLAQGLKTEYNWEDTANVVKALWGVWTGGQPREVVAFGGSYSGATCAWFRAHYPDLTVGCVSESGVVNALLTYTAFDEDVLHAARTAPFPYQDTCGDNLSYVTKAMMAYASDQGMPALKTKFNATNLIGTANGDTDFWYMVADAGAMMIQYGAKMALCTALGATPLDPAAPEQAVDRFAAVVATHYGADFGAGCFYDSECIKKAQDGFERSWRYQKCAELAYLQAAPAQDTVRHPSLSMDALVAQCAYMFAGLDPTLANDAFVALTGGADILTGTLWSQEPTNIVFVNYSDDPWQSASVTSALSETLTYCYLTCTGCGHCGAGVPSNETKCSDYVSEQVGGWLHP